jgi:hypothetical protein
MAYLIWEIYWSCKVGLAFIKWHTHLMVYVYVGIAGYLTDRALIRYPSEVAGNIALTIGMLLSALCAVEAVLCITGSYKTYAEKRGYSYVSPYNNIYTNGYNIRPANNKYYLNTSEYNYARMSNSLGFDDGQWSVAKKKGVKGYWH